MRTIGLSFLVLVCLSVSEKELAAQTYPSALITQLAGSRSIFLDEYTDPFQPRIKTTIFFTDFTESSWEFALRLKITGPNGIVIATKPGVKPTNPLSVLPGMPLLLEGSDLSFYFDYDNLVFSGISRQQLELNHRLPEGFYTFCFEAIDYESDRALSHPACASAYLSLLDPPLVLAPQHGQVIENVMVQNFLIQWQPGNITGNINLGDLRYQLSLYEVTNNWANPVTAIVNNQALPVWQSEPLTQNMYLYTMADPPLEKGKRYVFTVRAYELNGRGRFKNDGYSVPRYFRFGYAENDTLILSEPPEDHQFTLSMASLFSWKRPPKALPGQMFGYTLRVVEVDSLQTPESAMLLNPPFYQASYLATNNQIVQKTVPVTIWANIGRMKKYAWQVTARSGIQDVAKSEIRTFTGPPEIEQFIAGGFVMTVTRLDYFDRQNNIISGRCITRLRADTSVAPVEFAYKNIAIEPIGNNEWVLDAGSIADRILTQPYILEPDALPENGDALFTPDSVYVNTSGLRLAGTIGWSVPHLGVTGDRQHINSKRCRLWLANSTFLLNGADPASLAKNYDIELLDPLNFRLRLAQSSAFSVYQSRYTLSFDGFIQLPSNVPSPGGTAAHIAFSDASDLFYISETANESSESLRLARNVSFELLPVHYTIDLHDSLSPAEFSASGSWKGLYIEKSRLEIPPSSETSGQLTTNGTVNHTISNTASDTVDLYVDPGGMTLKADVLFSGTDSVRFNGFVSTEAIFSARIKESMIERAAITGSIQIPVIDTARKFPYYIELGDYGFSEGYLLNGLVNTTFTFNPAGSAEQQISATIKRAVFRGRNRLEMDLDLFWPYFSLTMNGVQRFSAWGNNNIGFDIPNGRYALLQQAQGKAAGFDLTVDQIGCGRSGNVYAFGASAKINMDEEISGDNGPPVINAYSMYRNPLLSGTLSVGLQSLQDSVTGAGSSAAQNGGFTGSAAGYSAAIGSGLSDALARLDFDPSDTLSFTAMTDESEMKPLLNANVITEVAKSLDIVYRLRPYINSQSISDKDWLVLDRIKRALQTDVVQQAQLTNARGLLNFMLNKAVDGLIGHLNLRIEAVGHLAVGKVRTAVHQKIADPVNKKVDNALSLVIGKLRQTAIAQAGEEHHAAIAETFSIVQASIANGIKTSVLSSFEQNIILPLDKTIHACVISKVTAYVRTEVSNAGQQLITNGVHAQISLDQILLNGHTMFADVADTVRDVLLALNGPNFVNTAESLVDDAINGIDWNAVAAEITGKLLQKGLSHVLATELTGAIAENADAYAAALLSSVKFDFSNIGQKLQNGQLDQIVKFDPTNIYIQSPAVDIRGKLVFTKGDPVYGDSWQSEVLVRVKVPKKDNPIECSGYFINGKTAFTYWLVKLNVSGLNIPLSPTPLVWDAAQGMAYSKMKRTGPGSAIPDQSNKFGVSCNFTFLDQQKQGGSLILVLGAEAEFNDGGFAIELNGNASLLNFQKQDGKYKSPGFVTGTGSIGYYKTPQYSKVAGNFNVQLNTQPVLCAGGNAGFDLRGPSDWKLWVGTKENPFAVKLLCKDFLQNTAYLQASNTGFGAGIMADVSLNAQSPWLELTGIKVRGFASFAFGYNVSTSMEWEPTFKITEATVAAWVSAAIGIDYETLTGTGSLTLAGVSLSGMLSYKSQPESELHGGLAGSITVVGFNVGFDTPVHYSLSKKEIIN